jgi:glucose-fructose oxidoreductase
MENHSSKEVSFTSTDKKDSSLSRRKLIKTLALGGAGLFISPNVLLACTAKQKNRLGVALVGLGYYSTDLLAPALQQTKNCYLG